MGIFRFALCLKCGKRYSKRLAQKERPDQCPDCGSRDFKFSDWYVSYFALGHSREEKVGGLDLARRVQGLRENEVAEGHFRLRKEKKILFRDFALGDYWNKYAKFLKGSKDYWNRIQQILPEFGDIWLHQIEQRDIEGWIARTKETNKPATVKRKLAFLSSIFSKAVDYKLIKENPARAVKLKKVDNLRNDYLSTEEYHELLKAAEESPMLQAAIIIAAGTGMRAGELFSMTWDWCDFKSREIRVAPESAKSGKSRLIPMIDPVYDALKNIPHRNLQSPFVLTSPRLGKPYSENMKGALEKAVGKAGLPDHYGWHIIGRHTFASWFVQDGGDIYRLQKILGHESLRTTERYAHLAPEHKRADAEKISYRFSAMTADIRRMEKEGKE